MQPLIFMETEGEMWNTVKYSPWKKENEMSVFFCEVRRGVFLTYDKF